MEITIKTIIKTLGIFFVAIITMEIPILFVIFLTTLVICYYDKFSW